MTKKNLVDCVNTLEELQQLVDYNPELYFDNMDGEHGFGGKFLIAQHQLKFSEDVIYEYAGRGLSVYIMLMRPGISEELRYYLRTLWHGLEETNELYFNPERWAKNEALTKQVAELEERINSLDCQKCTCDSSNCEQINLEEELSELLVHYMI